MPGIEPSSRGNSIKKWLIRICLLIKKQLREPGFYICLALSIVAAAVLMRVTAPGVVNSYGLLNGGGETADAVAAMLTADAENGFSSDASGDGRKDDSDEIRCVAYTELDEMKRDLMAGRIDCAFVLDERLDEAIETGSLKDCADYYCTPSTVQGEVLKERLYADIFSFLARQTLIDYAQDGETFEISGDDAAEEKEIEEALLEKYESYQKNPDIFQVEFVTENGDAAAEDTASSAEERVPAVAGILLFALALVFARIRFTAEYRRVLAAQSRSEGRLWSVAEVFAPMLLTAAAFWILTLFYGESFRNRALMFLAVFFLYAVICSLWSVLFAGLFRSEAFYLFSLLIVITLAALTCPSFFAYASLTPALAGLRWVFPLQYLRLLLL